MKPFDSLRKLFGAIGGGGNRNGADNGMISCDEAKMRLFEFPRERFMFRNQSRPERVLERERCLRILRIGDRGLMDERDFVRREDLEMYDHPAPSLALGAGDLVPEPIQQLAGMVPRQDEDASPSVDRPHVVLEDPLQEPEEREPSMKRLDSRFEVDHT